jgi:hypothetical protein
LLCLAVVGDHLRWVVTDDEGGALADWLRDASADQLQALRGPSGSAAIQRHSSERRRADVPASADPATLA